MITQLDPSGFLLSDGLRLGDLLNDYLTNDLYSLIHRTDGYSWGVNQSCVLTYLYLIEDVIKDLYITDVD